MLSVCKPHISRHPTSLLPQSSCHSPSDYWLKQTSKEDKVSAATTQTQVIYLEKTHWFPLCDAGENFKYGNCQLPSMTMKNIQNSWYWGCTSTLWSGVCLTSKTQLAWSVSSLHNRVQVPSAATFIYTALFYQNWVGTLWNPSTKVSKLCFPNRNLTVGYVIWVKLYVNGKKGKEIFT